MNVHLAQQKLLTAAATSAKKAGPASMALQQFQSKKRRLESIPSRNFSDFTTDIFSSLEDSQGRAFPKIAWPCDDVEGNDENSESDPFVLHEIARKRGFAGLYVNRCLSAPAEFSRVKCIRRDLSSLSSQESPQRITPLLTEVEPKVARCDVALVSDCDLYHDIPSVIFAKEIRRDASDNIIAVSTLIHATQVMRSRTAN
jgi:hypothetical protein